MVSTSQLDELLTSASVLVVVGPGGVGKTTLAAALGCRAVGRHGRRALVVTVDPARRLADTLGVSELPGEPVLVPVPDSTGHLWASMIDMARSWDELVRRLATDEEAVSLLANPMYRTLTRRFIQSHDYIALDQLCDLSDDERYDLVVVDTPPSSHAIDILDAPDRMIEFFDSRLLRWLTAPYRSRLVQVTARPFLAIAERLLGGPFLARIAEFFWLFSRLQPGFVRRATEVRRRLDDRSTGYVLVTTSDPTSVAQAGQLMDSLEARNHQPSLVIHNRALPRLDGDNETESGLGSIEDASLRAAIESLLGRDRRLGNLLTDRSAVATAVHRVGWRRGALTSIAELATLLDEPGQR